MMGPKSFEQCAGFLRIPGGNNPLDNSSVHPESYYVVESMAKDVQASLEELLKRAELRKQINKKKYVNETVGEFTIEDILKELEKPGRDPRAPIEEFSFDENIKSIEDVKPGMVVPGIVTNITNFGAFVDIGVKQDGLVHISQLSNTFVSDPNQVVKLQQKVRVTVTEVDVARKRIALSMKEQGEGTGYKPAQLKAGGQGTRKEQGQGSKEDPKYKNEGRRENKSLVKKAEPQNAFQAKLAELKKKFDN